MTGTTEFSNVLLTLEGMQAGGITAAGPGAMRS
jgi:hypothetical protein